MIHDSHITVEVISRKAAILVIAMLTNNLHLCIP
jgi:hypothetical protein